MDDPFCDQSKAYMADSTARGSAQAVTLYEQFKEAILTVEETLADDEKLLVSGATPEAKLLRWTT